MAHVLIEGLSTDKALTVPGLIHKLNKIPFKIPKSDQLLKLMVWFYILQGNARDLE